MKIRILHTNDIHSRLENFAKVVTKIKELKNENTIILDAGDFHDFMRVEMLGTKGTAGGRLLKLGGYEAVTVGNNEGFQGINILENMTGEDNIPLLSCNLYKENMKLIKGLKRSIIIKRGGIRFLIFGISPSYNTFFSLMNMYGEEQEKEIKAELENNKGKYDIAILLSHGGMREDKEFCETIKGIDVIIGGHSHVLMAEAEKINNTIVHQSGMFGTHLGVLDIEIKDNKIISFKGENINVEKEIPDEDIMKQISKEKYAANKVLGVRLYDIEKSLWHDVIEENPMTNFLADALREVVPCDFSIINSGILNGGIKKGPVSVKKLLEICPSPLNPTYMEIEGKYIMEALKESMLPEVCLADGKGSGFRGKYVGRLHVSGAVIEYDSNNKLKVIIDGKELEEDKVYKVATSDYLQRGTGYPSLANNLNEKYNEEYLRDTLKDYLCKSHFIERAFIERWKER